MPVPNQKLVKIEKTPINKNKGGDKWMEVIMDALNDAMQELNTIGSVKLYIYLVKQKASDDEDLWELSRVAFCNWSGLSKDTYHKAVKDLIEKGYLVKDNDDENDTHYHFYDWPKNAESKYEKLIMTF